MRIEKATLNDIEIVIAIYRRAVEFMRESGNPNQWIDGYPTRECIEWDISLERLYLIRDSEDEIVAQFCFFVGDDPTYTHIDGTWLNGESYGVVHRLASSGKVKGVAGVCFDWCFSQHPNMRIDTHEDNKIMQRKLINSGYAVCGVIIGSNGTPRIAFQRAK